MKTLQRRDPHPEVSGQLIADCGECCGLCCVALYCARSEGFPSDKAAGEPCCFLMPNFCCDIHEDLTSRGYSGCVAYDCFGAGQKVTQSAFGGANWRSSPETARQMFLVFSSVRNWHEIQWYLCRAAALTPAREWWDEIDALIKEAQTVTARAPEDILRADTLQFKTRAGRVLRAVGECVQKAAGRTVKSRRMPDLAGKNFSRKPLAGEDFSMALLIGADFSGCNLYAVNFLGADLRGVNLRGSDLRESVFLTQMQVNSAVGDRETRLPAYLSCPESWRYI